MRQNAILTIFDEHQLAGQRNQFWGAAFTDFDNICQQRIKMPGAYCKTE